MRKIKITERELFEKIKVLSNNEKVALVDSILNELDKPDPEIHHIWAEEARKRWKPYKSGEIETVRYEEVIKKHTDKRELAHV